MPLNPESQVASIVAFLQNIYAGKPAVIGVSGGIDSALSLTLLVRALGPDRVYPVFLPYKTQSTEDGKEAARWNGIPEAHWTTIDIAPIADAVFTTLGIDDDANVRRGNVMARTRMITLYDTAKKLGALVCGTENKSENLLGYFTRFGDAASDVEPIHHLYKTDVRALAAHLGLPQAILSKAPTAGLWEGQTDEDEMGFSYEDADRVLTQYVDEGRPMEEIVASGIDRKTVEAVLKRKEEQKFKHEVPYGYAEAR